MRLLYFIRSEGAYKSSSQYQNDFHLQSDLHGPQSKTPLISKNSFPPVEKASSEDTVLQMLWAIARVGLPASITQLFSMGMDLANMIFIGHSNDSAKIAGIGLGNLFINICSQAVILGLNGGISTLASQAYGAKNYRKVGIYLNRGRFIGLAFFIPQALLMLNCERILLLLGQDSAASAYAQEYTYYMIIAMLAHTQFDATRSYLNAIHKNTFVTMTMTITSVLHIFWCYYLVVYLNMGVKGVGIATMISYSQNCTVITIICKMLPDIKESFFLITRESIFEGWDEYMKIALPNTALIILEWGALEILALIASLINVDATSAQVIAMNAFIVLLQLPYGGEMGTVVCVGAALGEANAPKAISLLKIATILFFGLDSLLALVIICFKESIAHVFTSNPSIVYYLDDCFTAVALLTVVFGIHFILAGALRGLGLQMHATFTVLICQYGFSLPFGYLFSITWEQGVKGIWYGQIIGALSQMVTFTYILSKRVNWNEKAITINETMRLEKQAECIQLAEVNIEVQGNRPE
ncbi:hypothetical protein FGO68_gene15533 [Halteria grandinella]|uniref:Multidrug and toxic compound extrusion protein n=1 Tax=Halteria grandinella TaxID=5974 RepID=A0A8J8T3V3_HALGN|nr:hypothetical protein FGO68_gene15533 [Halteria grandinella]